MKAILCFLCFLLMISCGKKEETSPQKKPKDGQKRTQTSKVKPTVKQEVKKEKVTESISPEKLEGMYEYAAGSFVTRYVFTRGGVVSNHRNDKKAWVGIWATKEKQIMVTKPTGASLIFEARDDVSITHIANISDQKRTELAELMQVRYVKTTNNPAPPMPRAEKEKEQGLKFIGKYECVAEDGKIILLLNPKGAAKIEEQGKVIDQGIWTLKDSTLIVVTEKKRIVLRPMDDGNLTQIATFNEKGEISPDRKVFKRISADEE